jgi:hypothetical protein
MVAASTGGAPKVPSIATPALVHQRPQLDGCSLLDGGAQHVPVGQGGKQLALEEIPREIPGNSLFALYKTLNFPYINRKQTRSKSKQPRSERQ